MENYLGHITSQGNDLQNMQQYFVVFHGRFVKCMKWLSLTKGQILFYELPFWITI